MGCPREHVWKDVRWYDSNVDPGHTPAAFLCAVLAGQEQPWIFSYRGSIPMPRPVYRITSGPPTPAMCASCGCVPSCL